ncbi:hypothetical protein LTR95_019732, partial [Oleoguttula sp. CCFEE 5521]
MFVSSPPFGYVGTDDRTASTDWHPPVTSPGEMAYREFPYAGLPPTHVRTPQRGRSRSRGDSRLRSPSPDGIKLADTVAALWSSPRLSPKFVRSANASTETDRRKVRDAANYHGASCGLNASTDDTYI